MALAGLGALAAALTIVWAFSVRLRDASIIDIGWGPGFVLLAWTYYVLAGASSPRALALACAITVWGVRLGAHIYRRHRGEDPRSGAMREAHGHTYWWRSLFTVFWLQAAILGFVALPLLAAAVAGQNVTVSVGP